MILDLCCVFSLPLMFIRLASFSQLHCKMRLLNSAALAEITEILSVQLQKHWAASGDQKKLSWFTSICHPGNLTTAPLLYQAFELKLDLHEKCLFTILSFSTGWSFPKVYFKF